MKKREQLFLGEDFTYNKNIDKYYNNKDFLDLDYKTLYQCYNTCSNIKHNIYNYYEKLLHNNCDVVYQYGVRSYNQMMFTLHGVIKKDNKYYYIVITKSNNYYKEIDINEE